MRFLIIFLFVIASNLLNAQEHIEISEIKWAPDFNIHITFSNDSSSIHDIKALYHVNENPGTKKEFTYYPVSLDPVFIQKLKTKDLLYNEQPDDDVSKTSKIKTLWGSLHPIVGGGYIHFMNSLIYAIESEKLKLSSALMKRPDSKWKPKPMTESFKRTKNWRYYIPDNMALAHKEYKTQEKNNELGDIKILPQDFIKLFLETNDKKYRLLLKNNEFNKIAILDMMRLLIGSKYLGIEQINFIQASVTKAIMHYNINNLPSVIIFDNYNAAVAMTLDEAGYKIEKIVFNNEEELSVIDKNERVQKMELVIKEINEANKLVFETKLKNYYAN